MSLFDVHLSERRAWLATVALLVVLGVAVSVQVYLGFAGVRWAWFLVMIPLGYFLATVLGMTNRVAPHLLPLIRMVFPYFKLEEAERARLALNGAQVEKIQETLHYYELGDLDPDYTQDLVEHVYGTDLDAICCKDITQHLTNRTPSQERPTEAQRRSLSNKHLLLLHQSYHDGPVAGWWWRERRRLIPGLAVLLEESGRLPQKDAVFPVLRDDYLERVLQALPVFSLDLLRAQLKCLHAMWRDSLRLATFLGRHGLAAAMPLPGTWLAFLEDRKGLPVKSPDDDIAPLLRWITEDAIRRSLEGLSPQEVSRYGSITLAIFASEELTQRESLRQIACEAVAEDPEAVPIVMAFLELREQLEHGDYSWEGETFVTVHRLFLMWADKVLEIQDRLGTGFKVELETLRRDLQAGTWNDRLPRVIHETLEKMSETNEEVLRVVTRLEEKNKSYDSAKRVFRGLSLETIERYLEARNVNAYLMTFDARRGRLADLIDTLVNPEQLAELGIEATVDGQPKYIFKHYTPSARIGVVPRGWSFERFHHSFQEDFTAVVKSRGALFPELGDFQLRDVELILQRFGLQDHYAFDSRFRSRNAVKHIKDLFAEILDPEEMMAVIAYQSSGKIPILSALAEGPISELAGELFRIEEITDPELMQSVVRQRKVLDTEGKVIVRNLLEDLDRTSVAELGRSMTPLADAATEQVAAARSLQTRAETALASSIRSLDRDLFGKERSIAIAASYLGSLRVIVETAA